MRDLHQQGQDFRTADLPSFSLSIPNEAVWGFFAGVLATVAVMSTNFLDRSFMDSLAPEAIGILVTVLFINQLNRRSEREQYKRRLIHELGSRVNDVALRAVEELKKEGWLEDGSLHGADLRDANLQGAVLEGANLQGAVLWGANLQGAVLWEANLQGAVFGGANLQGVVFGGANLQGAVFGGANLRGTVLNYANLQKATFGGANLQGAVLNYANLQKANLIYANLQGADLRYANLRNVIFIDSAIFDTDTILPNGDKWHDLYDIYCFTDSTHTNF